MHTPLTRLASSEARYRHAFATSSGVENRPSGMVARKRFFASSVTAPPANSAERLVSGLNTGFTQFTRILSGPNSAAMDFDIRITAALELLRPWPVGLVFDYVLGTAGVSKRGTPLEMTPETLLLVSCAIIVATSLLIGFLTVRQAVVSARVGKSLATRVRRSLFERLHRLALPFHRSSRTGDLLVRLMGDVNMVRDLLFASWLNLTTRGILFVGTAVMLFVVDPLLGALALAPLPLLAFGVRRSSKKLAAVTHKQRKKEG